MSYVELRFDCFGRKTASYDPASTDRFLIDRYR